MNKKLYTYKEVKTIMDQETDPTEILVNERALELMRDILDHRGLSIDDRVWEWPKQNENNTPVNDAYERAMSVI